MTEPTDMNGLIREAVAATVTTVELGEGETFGDGLRGALRGAGRRGKPPEASGAAKALEAALGRSGRRSGGDH